MKGVQNFGGEPLVEHLVVTHKGRAIISVCILGNDVVRNGGE
jgi:hypothetical protein